jgi:hypothetical protein
LLLVLSMWPILRVGVARPVPMISSNVYFNR